MVEVTVVLKNEEGLHARPAAIFSSTAKSFECDLKMYKDDNKEKEHKAKSVISVMAMGAAKGDAITIVANGSDEKEAVEKLKTLIDTNFGE